MPRFVVLFIMVWTAVTMAADTGQHQLFRDPTMNTTTIVFSYGGDLWSVPREGGQARQLTTGAGIETNPVFSPDGRQIAFTGQYDGNTDVFIIPAEGGVPRRLTYHPGPDAAVSWTPDGRSIVFVSYRSSYSRFPQLWTVSVDGGFPTVLPLPEAYSASYSPDGTRVAYTPLAPAFHSWKRYRGGRASYLQIARLDDLATTKIPREKSNDFNPMWIGDKVYFLSDRNGSITLFAYDVAGNKVSQVLDNKGFDFKSASAGPGGIVYEQFGGLHIYDPATGKVTTPRITVAGDFPEVRPRLESVSNSIRNSGISPSGVRAVFEARGEILTVPADKGDIRNLTRSPGVNERSPAWSPDGRWVAYFSDESGEYALHIQDQLGTGTVRKISLGTPPSFFYDPTWSPDSNKICFTDKRLNIWYVDLEQDNPVPVKVDTDLTYNRRNQQNPVWSPDSRWIAYSRLLDNRLAAIFAYSLEDGKSRQLTDGMSDAQYPAFDHSGKYLYFAASTNIGPSEGEGLSTMDKTVTRNVYVAVLDASLPSPLAPESDDEKVKPEKKTDDKAAPEMTDKAPAKGGETPAGTAAKTDKKDAAAANGKDKGKEKNAVKIDTDGFAQRILALPVPARNYVFLATGKDGQLFMLSRPEFNPYSPGPMPLTVYKFDLNKRKEQQMVGATFGFSLSADGQKMLIRQGRSWAIVPTAAPAKPGQGRLNLSQMKVWVDPPKEWHQMYHEVWRGERDFFYSPQFHGLDLARAEKRYAPFLESVVSREDLNYLFGEMLGELTVSHLFVRGGDTPDVERVPGGLLGADFATENGRYRFTKIYNGEGWNPDLEAPLTQPGVNVRSGEYLLAINGENLAPPRNVYELLEATAGKQVVLKVGPNPDGSDAHEVTVVPVASEYGLRNLDWIESNRRKVDELSGGRIAYVYLPNTHLDGFVYFNRYFFSQLNKDAVLIDERYNGGGALADYIVDYLRRPLLNYITGREGKDDVMPYGAVFGPKAMLINEYAGSGGDALPYYFHKMNIGPLIGKRTWGGLVRAGGMPVLMDGGRITAPDAALWSPQTGEWIGENKGIAPDMEVEQAPAAVAAGHDPQLEAGVKYLLEELKKNPPKHYQHPPYSDYHQDRNWPKK